jgi:hypothetical protein
MSIPANPQVMISRNIENHGKAFSYFFQDLYHQLGIIGYISSQDQNVIRIIRFGQMKYPLSIFYMIYMQIGN